MKNYKSFMSSKDLTSRTAHLRSLYFYFFSLHDLLTFENILIVRAFLVIHFALYFFVVRFGVEFGWFVAELEMIIQLSLVFILRVLSQSESGS